ncbi:MAG: cytochrome c biogenesis protein CcsA [Rubrivivax sp.]|nr:cytochrome c biogenesis protein CcsA [Rubrivivax sp.]MCL4696490.1 cytochrome c biogenesis protein CcsA [Burkholderiaceae bacterium]
MILSSAPASLAPGGGLLLAGVTLLLYALAAVPAVSATRGGETWRRLGPAALVGAFVLHLLLLLIDIGGFAGGSTGGGMRWGFGPVLSMTVWLMIAVHQVESRLLPLPTVRLALALAGIAGVVFAVLFPGDARHGGTVLAPLHFALGVGSYGLFAAAVLHASLLDRAERRLRSGAARTAGAPAGLPLLQLERLTFRFVEIGFIVLTLTLLLGVFSAAQWRWDHKSVFSLLAWGVFAALLIGRHRRGWRGRQATRWLYVGAALLLLAYVGSRFVLEVLLRRAGA